MSGHSKWSQIKHRKAITDKKKGQLFSKLSKLITIAARKGTDPKSNIALAHAIERARAINMPNENIERAIKKTSGDSAHFEEISIEAIGPGNVAIRIKSITDNRNRTVAEIKKILGDHRAKMVPPGSLAWMFEQSVAPSEADGPLIDALLEVLDDHDDVDDVTTNLSSEL